MARKPYPSSNPHRRVPGKLANEMAGDRRYPEGKDGRPIKASTVISRGRRDSGMKNPRRGGYMEQDVREQLMARPGMMPQGDRGSQDYAKAELINSIIRNEGKKNYDKEALLKELADKDAKKKVKKKRGLKDIGNDTDNDAADEPDDDEDDN